MIAVLILAAAAAATTPEPVCVRQEVVPGFEAWGHGGGTALAVGQVATLSLQPAEDVHFRPALARPAAKGSFGGYFPFSVARAGRYSIAASPGAWIDVVAHGHRLKSVAHRHGPPCSGIAKIVSFDLEPGRYWVQLSEAKAPSLSAMISASR